MSTPPPPPVSNVPSKPDEDDRIGPVGTAYTPIKLQPKKLVNPFAAREAQAQAEAAPPRSSHAAGGAKKLTWSERHALAQKQEAEEEARSKAASFQPPPAAPVQSTTRSFGGASFPPPPPIAPAAPEPEEDEFAAPVRFINVSTLDVSYAYSLIHSRHHLPHLQQAGPYSPIQRRSMYRL